jgi:hypothetical protein
VSAEITKEFGSADHLAVVGDESKPLLPHILLTISDQALSAVCMKTRLVAKALRFV